ncbi:MAG: hypothetical protein KGH72_04745 [Candidatus Micrarchaeota archaeon]|nr:hypothetical protein [Candidatus Micrarchaeota archaeon]
MQEQQMIHYPRLDTVLMVEEALKNAKEYPSKRQLWLALKKKVMYQTFNTILSYLEDSGKVMIKDSKVIWIWNPELVKRYRKSNLVLK